MQKAVDVVYEEECEDECYDAEPEEFDPVKYEQRVEQRLRQQIERDIKKSKDEREKSEIGRRLAKKLLDEYYGDKLNDAPYYITRMLGKDDEDESALNIPKDDVDALENEVKKLNARQTEIFEHFCNKEKFNELRSKRMTGQYVSEYKKIEGLKSVLLDRLQMVYLGKPFGESFNSNFCEPQNYNGQNREYRF